MTEPESTTTKFIINRAAVSALDQHYQSREGDRDHALQEAAMTGVNISMPSFWENAIMDMPEMAGRDHCGRYGPDVIRAAMDDDRLTFTLDGYPIEPLIESAAEDKCAYDAIKLIIENRLARVADTPLTPALRDWYSQNHKRPRKGSHKNQTRDRTIVQAVRELVDLLEVSATRNDASESWSACDAVAEALTARGEPCGYDRVKQLWNADVAFAKRIDAALDARMTHAGEA